MPHQTPHVIGVQSPFFVEAVTLLLFWWRRRESNPTSVLKTLNLLILGMTALQETQ